MDLSPADVDALFFRLVKERDHGSAAIYGYEVFLPSLVHQYLWKQRKDPSERGPSRRDIAPLVNQFYPLAWDYCRRGILRPGVREFDAQATSEGSTNGFSVTPFGEQWFEMADRNDFLPTEPGRFGQMLAPHRAKFGNVFHERAQEAMRCYGAQANLACCVMCGAAAETILLVAAEAKLGEDEARKEYRGAAGRSKIENALLGKSRLRDGAQPYLSLLNYWRTDGAHGRPSNIKENEAYTSLALLLRFALFVTDNWSVLTDKRARD